MEERPGKKPARRLWQQLQGPRSPQSSLGNLADYGAKPISGTARDEMLGRSHGTRDPWMNKKNASAPVVAPEHDDLVSKPHDEEE